MPATPPDADADPTAARAMLHDAPATFSAVLNHYLTVFTYDAGQRLSTFQYFLTAFAFLTAAYTAIMTAKLPLLPSTAGAPVSAAAYAMALLFGRLDKRNAQIVEIDQVPIVTLQAAIAAELGDHPSWHSFAQVHIRAQRLTTYGSLFPLVYFVTAMIAAGGGWLTLSLAGYVGQIVALAGTAVSAVAALVLLKQNFPLKH